MQTRKTQTRLQVRMIFIVAIVYIYILISSSQQWQSLTSRAATIETALHKWAGRFGTSVFSLIRKIYLSSSKYENRVGIAEFSQKSDLVLAELLQTIFDLNRHINAHGKKRGLWPASAPAETNEDVHFSLSKKRLSRPHYYICARYLDTRWSHSTWEQLVQAKSTI